MRRSDREVLEPAAILEIVAKCDVCRLALNGPDGYPYILPLNFGFRYVADSLTLYFHSALEGTKHRLIEADNRACFEMDCDHSLRSEADRGYCTMDYASVIGRGHIYYIDDPADKAEALRLLTDRYHAEHFAYNAAAVQRTSVYCLRVESLTAKRKK